MTNITKTVTQTIKTTTRTTMTNIISTTTMPNLRLNEPNPIVIFGAILLAMTIVVFWYKYILRRIN